MPNQTPEEILTPQLDVPDGDVFALSDEDILGIDAADGNGDPNLIDDDAEPTTTSTSQKTGAPQTATAGQHDSQSAGNDAPQWLAELMADQHSGAQARELWDGLQRTRGEAAAAQQEAAEYREVFAKPAEARAAAERAHALEQIDQSYFSGSTSDRTRLAESILREDPAAFREMVEAGVRLLQDFSAASAPQTKTIAAALRTQHTSQSQPTDASAGATNSEQHRATNEASHDAPSQRVAAQNATQQYALSSEQQEKIAAYAAFERSANEDLERSVGSAIERTLQQALPSTGRAENAALRNRLTATIRQDVETALQGDRQLGEQVAQILNSSNGAVAPQWNQQARSQVVRLINERAQQILPGAAKRVLADWTQTTISAHQQKTTRADAAGKREAPPAANTPHRQETKSAEGKSAQSRAATSVPSGRGTRQLDYGKLSDDQILAL